VGACGPAESGILVGSTFPLICPLAGGAAVAGFDVDPIANTVMGLRRHGAQAAGLSRPRRLSPWS